MIEGLINLFLTKSGFPKKVVFCVKIYTTKNRNYQNSYFFNVYLILYIHLRKYDVVCSVTVRLLNMFDRCHANQTEKKLILAHNKCSLPKHLYLNALSYR